MRRRGRVFQPRKGKSASWAYKVDVAPPGAPKRDQRTRGGFRTKREAQQALNELLVSIGHGTFRAPAKLTFGAYLEQWLDGLGNRQGYKATTVHGYRRNMRNHVLSDPVAHIQLQDLAPEHLDALYDRLLESGRASGKGGLAPRTVRYDHDVISAALRDARKRGLVVRNVASDATPPGKSATKAPEVVPWSMSELQLFLRAARTDEHAVLWRLAALTGMRRGELIGLRWLDVELDRGLVHVRQSLTVIDNEPVVSTPKTSEGRRTIAIDPISVDALRSHRTKQKETVGAAEWVFTSPSGDHLQPNRITYAFTALLRRRGLRHIKFHGLRHTHATLMLHQGVNVKTVSERLGHASVSFTLERYVHSLANTQENAALGFADQVEGMST